MLRMTRVTLELLTDPDMLLMIESGIRGGLVQVSLRHAVANNPHLSDPLADYDENKPKSWLLLLDAINLYGFSQSSCLPTGNFRFVESPESLDWSTLPVDAPTGYILEADVTVPESVHDKLQYLPPLPELEAPPGSKGKKLLATLNDKKKYVAHYSVFQQAVRLGLRVTKVHRAISFSQSPFIKKFVDFNAEMRAKNSTNEFYYNIFKLMNNANYGRLLMNKRNHRDVRIVTKDSLLQKLIRNPQFAEHVIIAPDVVLVYMKRKSVTLNSPIYAGMCVLDIAKVHMYRFYYDVLCENFTSDELKLCYTDTDSYLLNIKTERDLFQILTRPAVANHLDLSVYPVGHPLKDDTNKGKIGCFKDESRDGKQIQEFVGLRAKMYVYRYGSDESELKYTAMKAKGIKTSYVKRNLSFDDYKNTLFSGTEPEKAEFNQIRSRLFRVTTKTVVKRSLSAADDKRVINSDGITTLPYGHYSLANITAEEDSGSSDVHNNK